MDAHQQMKHHTVDLTWLQKPELYRDIISNISIVVLVYPQQQVSTAGKLWYVVENLLDNNLSTSAITVVSFFCHNLHNSP